ncbi:MAG: hypothetical protein ABJK28_10625 [Algibacter sp.]
MNLKHCDLCENQITSFKNGFTCALTNKKPSFEKTCTKIELNGKLQSKLEHISIELEKIRKNKNSMSYSFYIQIIIGFTLIFISIFILKKNYSGLLIYYFMYILVSIGLTLFGNAYKVLNRYRKKVKNAEFHKKSIDELLEEYGIQYNTNIIFQEKIHGIQELIVELEFINWKKERTKTPYKINC